MANRKDDDLTKQFSPSSLQTGGGNSFGRYRIMAEIGRGGMGVVYKVYDPELKRLVALKLLNPQDISDRKSVERFLREARATAQLNHPNIVRVYDIGCQYGKHFFTMDFIEGISLREMLRENPPGFKNIAHIMAQVGNAVHHAHRMGIIHRDLKPANVMLDEEKVPKVMDFGLAKISEASKKLSKSGMILGTLQYMPPEQAEGRLTAIDERSDVYSLGAMLYEMLTGRPPFCGSTSFNIIYQIIRKDPIPPGKIKRHIPTDLELVCLKCLEKDKRLRYQSAAAFVDDLARFRRGETVEARPIGIGGHFYRKIKRNKTLMAIALAMIFAITLASIWFVLQLNSAKSQLQWEKANVILKNQELKKAAKRLQQEIQRAKAAEANALEKEKLAKKSTIRAQESSLQAQIQLYRMHVILVDKYLRDGDIGRAERILDISPDKMRRWEWQWLKGRCRQSRLYRKRMEAAWCDFAPDGNTLGAATYQGDFYLWDSRTGREISRFSWGQRLKSCAFSPNGGKVICYGPSGAVIRSLQGDRPVFLKGYTGSINCCAFSPDGSTVASGYFDMNVILWNAETGEVLHILKGHKYTINDCVFSPNGKILASGCSDQSIRFWNAKTGKPMDFREKKMSEHDSILCLDFSPDGKTIVAGGASGILRLYRVSDGKVLWRINAHTSMVEDCAFGNDGETILSAGEDRTVKLWSRKGEKLAEITGHFYPVTACSLSQDGKVIATAGRDAVVAWYTEHETVIRTIKTGNKVQCMDISADGKKIIVAGTYIVEMFDFDTGQKLANFSHNFLNPELYGCLFSADGKTIVSAGDDSALIAWDVASGKRKWVRTDHHGGLRCCTLSHDGKTLASGGEGKKLRLWEMATGKLLFTVDTGFEINDCAFTPDGQIVTALNTSGNNLALWQVGQKIPIYTIHAHGESMTCCAINADGRFIVTGGRDNLVKLWNAKGDFLQEFKGHAHDIEDVAISRDGERIVSCSADGTLRLWGRDYQEEIIKLCENRSLIYCCMFSPNGKTIIAGEDQGDIEIWDSGD